MSELMRALMYLHNWQRDHSWISARLGRDNGDGTYTIRVADRPGWVHVRKGVDGKGGPAFAYNRGVPHHPNLRVRMLEEYGHYVIYGEDTFGGAEQTGGGTGTGGGPHAVTHDRLGPDPLYIRGLAFLPLACRPTSPASMAVTVERAFYRYDGVAAVWDTGDTASLSAYVPSTPVQQHFVVVSLNRATGALVVTDGASAVSVSSDPPFDATDVLDIVDDLPDSYWPSAAVRFYYGQTRITAADIFMDLRLWGGELGVSAGGTFTASDIMTDANGDIMVDANGNVMVQS